MKKLVLIFASVMLLMFCFTAVYADGNNIKLTDVRFTANGTDITTIADGDIVIYATVNSDNILFPKADNVSSYDKVMFFSALYENGALKDIDMTSKNAYGGNNTYRLGAKKVTDAANSEIKVFVTENGMKPYSKAVKLSAADNDTKISSFSVNGTKAEINNLDNIIWLETCDGGDVTSVKSYECISQGTVSPEAVTAVRDGDTFTVTAADGSKRVYTVKIEKSQLCFSVADMEGITLTDGKPSKGAADKADWDLNSYCAGEGTTATAELAQRGVNDQYFKYSTGEAPKTAIYFAKRSWSVKNGENEKTTYSFDLNMEEQTHSYNSIPVTFGISPTVRLLICNYATNVGDDAILKNNSMQKYQIGYSYTGKSNQDYANIATLDVGKWYNIKTVVRRTTANIGLIEIYINDEMRFSTPYWFGHSATASLPNGAAVNSGLLTTNNFAINNVDYFKINAASWSKFAFGLDNIALYYTNPDIVTQNTIYLLGDSISSYYTSEKRGIQQGWGNYLKDKFDVKKGISLVNYAQGGMSAASFVNGTDSVLHPWSEVKGAVKQGDYVFIALGANDYYHGSKPESQESAFKANLTTMINDTVAKGAEPILFTPHVTAINDSSITNEYHEYVDYIKEVAQATNTTLIDLNAAMLSDFQAKGWPVSAFRSSYYVCNKGVAGFDDPSVFDYTHLNETGAQYVTGLIENIIRSGNTSLKEYLVAE